MGLGLRLDVRAEGSYHAERVLVITDCGKEGEHQPGGGLSVQAWVVGNAEQELQNSRNE